MIAGVATCTIVMSTRIMKKPRQSAKSAGQGFLSPDRAAGLRSGVDVGHGRSQHPTMDNRLP